MHKFLSQKLDAILVWKNGTKKKYDMITNLFVEKGDTKPDKDIIYMKKLNYALSKILTWYFDTGKIILDVTAGERRTWNNSDLYNLNLDGKLNYNIIFADVSRDAKADILCDFCKLPFADNSVDLIYFDPPFIKLANAIESFGIKTHITPNREEYFRQAGKWIPPETRFFQTWKEFNRVSRNGLIVKISERYEQGYEIPVTTYMDLAYDSRFNKKSQFKRCVKVGYRGKRAGMGAMMIHAQRVLSYYAIYKKDYRVR